MLVVAVVLNKFGEAWGLPNDNYFIPRLCLLIMGIWWAVFSLPILLIVRDKAAAAHAGRSLSATAVTGLQDVMRTLGRHSPLSHAGDLLDRLFDL